MQGSKMKPQTLDLSDYKYSNGSEKYQIDLTEYKNAAHVYIDVHSTHDVTIELILSGSGEVFTHSCGKHLKVSMAIINCDAIRLITEKTAYIAYIVNLKPHGGYEILDPTPVSIAPVSNEFFLSDLIRRELSKRLAHMGMKTGDVDDLLDEDDFDFEDEDDASELPEDTDHTETLEEELPTDPEETPAADDPAPPPSDTSDPSPGGDPSPA